MTTVEARDEIFALFQAAWALSAESVISPIPKILWQGQETSEPPRLDARAFARITVKHNQRDQGSLSGADGTRRWAVQGLVFVQCFGAISTGRGLAISESLAIVAKDAFEGVTTPSGIWFRKARTNEVGPSDGWYQVNAVAEFTYDEVR